MSHKYEQLFSLDNPEGMYWLGMLYADGCVTSNNKSRVLAFGLQKKDSYLVEQFKNFLGVKNKLETRENFTQIRITSAALTDCLIKLGVVPRKSLVLKFPPSLLENSHLRHFIRGYFDGDGCVSEKHHKHCKWLHVSFVGTLDMMQNLSRIFEKLGMIPRKLIRQGRVYNLHISRKEDIQRIKKFLYDAGGTCLLRKKSIFDNFSPFKTGLSSKYRGICFCSRTKKWRATFKNGKIRKEKSNFSTEEEAYQFLKNHELAQAI